MTISPWAMLMTPITPKVMARPMAASSSTEPSDNPYQMFCTWAQRARRVWMALAPSSAEAFTRPSFAAAMEESREAAS